MSDYVLKLKQKYPAVLHNHKVTSTKRNNALDNYVRINPSARSDQEWHNTEQQRPVWLTNTNQKTEIHNSDSNMNANKKDTVEVGYMPSASVDQLDQVHTVRLESRSQASAEEKKETENKNHSIDMSSAMELQPTINIGTIGHVAHGKSTLTRALTGVRTGKSQKEQERNMTIKLGYANAKLWRCRSTLCPRPWCFQATGAGQSSPPKCKRPGCTEVAQLVRHVSFVDSPGHHDLMATMLSGAAVMDAAIMVVAANEGVAPQTQEHMAAAELMGIADRVLVCQNKIDLVSPQEAQQRHMEIKSFLQDTSAERAPIVPVAAELGLNVDVLCDLLCTRIPEPKRDLKAAPFMPIVRSFDVNKPGRPIKDLRGGVVGGSLTQGVLKLGDSVELRPGIVRKTAAGFHVSPLFGSVVSLLSEKQKLQHAVPGGLIAVGLDLDPCLAKADRLVGQVLGGVGTLPSVFARCTIKYRLMNKVCTQEDEADMEKSVDIGFKSEDTGSDWDTNSTISDATASTVSSSSSSSRFKVKGLKKKENMLFCIGASRVEGVVVKVKNKACVIDLDLPVCSTVDSRVAIFRNVTPLERTKHWRLVGSGSLKDLEELTLHSALSIAAEIIPEETEVEKAPKENAEVKSADEDEVGEKDEEHLPLDHSHRHEQQADEEDVITPGPFNERLNSCRFYEQELPEVNENVMVHVDRIEDAGVYVTLLEYDNVEGFIPVRELSGKRIRSIKQVIRVNQQLPCSVFQVHQGNVDLSKRRVDRADAKECGEWYKQSRVLHAILTRVSATTRIPLSYLTENFAWPLYDFCAELSEESEEEVRIHPLEKLKQVAHLVAVATAQDTALQTAVPKVVDEDLKRIVGPKGLLSHLVEVARAALLKNLCHRLSSKPSRIRAEIELLCFAPNGCSVVKAMLMKTVAQHERRMASIMHEPDEDEEPLHVYQESPPKYVVTMASRHLSEAISFMKELCEDVGQLMKEKGGDFRVTLQPTQQQLI